MFFLLRRSSKFVNTCTRFKQLLLEVFLLNSFTNYRDTINVQKRGETYFFLSSPTRAVYTYTNYELLI